MPRILQSGKAMIANVLCPFFLARQVRMLDVSEIRHQRTPWCSEHFWNHLTRVFRGLARKLGEQSLIAEMF